MPVGRARAEDEGEGWTGKEQVRCSRSVITRTCQVLTYRFRLPTAMLPLAMARRLHHILACQCARRAFRGFVPSVRHANRHLPLATLHMPHATRQSLSVCRYGGRNSKSWAKAGEEGTGSSSSGELSLLGAQ